LGSNLRRISACARFAVSCSFNRLACLQRSWGRHETEPSAFGIREVDNPSSTLLESHAYCRKLASSQQGDMRSNSLLSHQNPAAQK
jgi:hypothetical protein